MNTRGGLSSSGKSLSDTVTSRQICGHLAPQWNHFWSLHTHLELFTLRYLVNYLWSTRGAWRINKMVDWQVQSGNIVAIPCKWKKIHAGQAKCNLLNNVVLQNHPHVSLKSYRWLWVLISPWSCWQIITKQVDWCISRGHLIVTFSLGQNFFLADSNDVPMSVPGLKM